jgi:tetrahydromethanopterin S-methyltransferase subunit G
MPLSEQEQRLLDEMERSLYHGDADFVASVGKARGRMSYGAVIGGVLLAVAGIGLLVLGVLLHNWVVGALGFAAMFGGVLLALGVRDRRAVAAFPVGAHARRPGFMDRLNQRWERRRQS